MPGSGCKCCSFLLCNGETSPVLTFARQQRLGEEHTKGASICLHVVLLDKLEEVEGVRELQADIATVEGGGSFPLHLLIPVLAELGHQLQQQMGTAVDGARGCYFSMQPHPSMRKRRGCTGQSICPGPESPSPQYPSPSASEATSGPLTFTRMSLDSLGFVLEKHCPKQRKMVKSGERSLRLSRKSRSSAKRGRAWT